jgi:hypothetical protein
MATAIIPPSAQLSEAAEHRNLIFSQNMPRLQNFAWRALNVLNKKNSELVVVCIQVDSRWRALVDTLMPGYDWDEIRATGVDPLARGTAWWGVCKIVAEEFPDIAHVALEVPEEGKFKAIVLTDEGCTIYDIDPKPLNPN